MTWRRRAGGLACEWNRLVTDQSQLTGNRHARCGARADRSADRGRHRTPGWP